MPSASTPLVVVFRLLGLLSLGAAPLLPAATYYVSPTGNNALAGTSPATAWQTLAKVNGSNFAAGDEILFESGQTFPAPSGSDALIIRNAGSSDSNRITYGIYNGTARAIIQQTDVNRNGVKFAAGNDWVTVQDLEIVGAHAWAANIAGAEIPHGIYLEGSQTDSLQGTTLQRLVVRNFKGSGIRSGARALTYQRLSDTRIEYVEVYHVGDAGIRLGYDGDPQDGEIRQNIYIGHCYVHHTAGFSADNLHHGDGIQIACGKNVTIEYCVVHDTSTAFTGTDGGPVGIWIADVHNGVIQFCESYSNSNGNGSIDGGGIDIDGGCLDSVVQYCYTHDNDGPGYLLAHWGAAGGTGGSYCSPTNRNTFRYNLSVNDSKAVLVSGGISVWTRDGAAILDNRFHNNLVVQTRVTTGNANPAIEYRGSPGTAANPNRAYNNIFITSNGHSLSGSASTANFQIKNNLWWALNGVFTYGNHSLATVDSEGREENPLLTAPSSLLSAPTIGFANIDRMPQLLATHFRLLAASPAIDQGADLTTAAYGSLSVGSRDFFGNSLPENVAYDIGPHEFVTGGAGELSLASLAITRMEGSSLDITVTRTVGTAGTASVRVRSQEGTAIAGSDFTSVDATLSWADGETGAKSVSISLLDNAVIEGDEVFTVVLSEATGAIFVGSSTATATILDNDIPPSGPVEVIVDNSAGVGAVTLVGAWTNSTSNPGYLGTNYVHDGNAGKGTKSVRFTPDLPHAGIYEVYMRWPAWISASNNAPVSITHVGGTANTTVSQRANSGVWMLIGTHTFNAGTGGHVTISNTGTTQHVFADAVRFVKGDTTEVIPSGYAAWTSAIAWGENDAAPAADADGDGLANLLEYALDSSPIASTSGPGALPAVVIDNDGDLTLTFTRLRPELTYTVQAATTLGTWIDVAVNPGVVGESVTVPHPAPDEPRRFLRLRVSNPAE